MVKYPKPSNCFFQVLHQKCWVEKRTKNAKKAVVIIVVVVMSEFEEIIEHLGAFGPYQVRVFLLVSAFETPAAWAMLLPVFAHAKPAWECSSARASVSGDDVNVTVNSTVTEQCTPDGHVCEGANYTSDFTSIVSEVRVVHVARFLLRFFIIITNVLCGIHCKCSHCAIVTRILNPMCLWCSFMMTCSNLFTRGPMTPPLTTTAI